MAAHSESAIMENVTQQPLSFRYFNLFDVIFKSKKNCENFHLNDRSQEVKMCMEYPRNIHGMLYFSFNPL